MAGDTANARIWLKGDCYVAPVGTTAPTDLTTAWDPAWTALGVLSEDGLTEARNDDSNDYGGWGTGIFRTVRSKHKRTFKVMALENNNVVFQLVNPGSTSATATGVTTRTVKDPTLTHDVRAFGFETHDGAVNRRILVPKGEVTEVADVTSSQGDLTGWELTITVTPASDGTLYTELTDDAGAVVA